MRWPPRQRTPKGGTHVTSQVHHNVADLGVDGLEQPVAAPGAGVGRLRLFWVLGLLRRLLGLLAGGSFLLLAGLGDVAGCAAAVAAAVCPAVGCVFRGVDGLGARSHVLHRPPGAAAAVAAAAGGCARVLRVVRCLVSCLRRLRLLWCRVT